MTHINWDFVDVILFDGECNLCNGFVNFVIDRDHKKRFVFTSLQSENGKHIQELAGISSGDIDSVMLYSPVKNTFQKKSTAIIYILKHFKGLWPLSVAFLWVPRYLRDLMYDFVAGNRYRWFGKTSCRIPTPELKQRFI